MITALRSRLLIIVLAVFGGVVFSGFELWRTYEAYEATQARISEILELRAKVLFLDANSYSKRLSDQLQKERRHLGNDPRAKPMSDIIQAYNERDPRRLRQELLNFLTLEKKVYSEQLQKMRAAEAEMKQHAASSLLLPILGLLLVYIIVRVRIFRPIDRLSRRMMDFLVDRYSFQFSEPEANELGALQRTFNSLAQRVINNMDELKSLDQAKSDFLSITSHELRTPMTSIKGSLSLLTSGVMGRLDPQAEKLLKIAENETDRLIRLINDLLDLAKIEAGKLPLACSWTNWDDVMHITAQGLLGLAQTAKVSIAVQTEPGLEVYMDKDRMQQILTNLISNAVKFSPEKGIVSVFTSKTRNGELLIQVQDQGVGIAPEDQELIFQKFRQSSSPENPIVKGTGLGLTIARALVEEHGGTIGVHSEKDKGATFYFTLPKWRDATGASGPGLGHERSGHDQGAA